MNRKIKRLAVLLVLSMVLNLSVIPVQAAGEQQSISTVNMDETQVTVVESGSCGENLTWTLDDTGLLQVSGTGAMTDWSVFDDGTCDSPWYKKSAVKEVVIDSGVTNVGDCAFYKCWDLTGISIPDSVSAIGSNAFYYCESLTSVTIPSGVTSIGDYAFANCWELGRISIPDSVTDIGRYAFDNCTSLTKVFYSSGEKQWKEIFIDSGNDSLISATICFYGVVASGSCGSTKWKLDGDYKLTFYNSGSMENYFSYENVPWSDYVDLITCVEFESGVTNIGSYSIRNMPKLCSVIIPDSVKMVGNSVFYGCEGLKSAGPIGSGCNIEYGWTNKIPDDAFRACRSLTNISIPGSISRVGDSVFYGCEGLKSAGPTGSGCNIEYGWTKEIPANVFKSCRNLTRISIPVSITNIGDYAFGNLKNLTAVYFGGTEEQWKNIEKGSGNPRLFSVAIYCSDNVVRYPSNNCGENLTWTLDDTGLLVISGTGNMAGWKYDPLPWYNETSLIKEVLISSGVTSIGEFAFNGCKNLEKINIPSGIADIKEYAFGDCRRLTGISLPSSVTSIGYSAFYGCSNLTDVYYNGSEEQWKKILIDNGNERLTSAHITFSGVVAAGYSGDTKWSLDSNHRLSITGSGMMRQYDSYKDVPWYAYADQISSVEIGEGVTRIGDNAFYGLSDLQSVILPDSITIIGDYAFKNDVNLKTISLPRNLRKLGEGAFYGCHSLEAVTIPEGIYTIWGYTFKNCSALKTVTLPENLIKIDEAAFYGCSSLTELSLPGGTEIVGQYAFKYCTKLKNLTLSARMKEIREAAFYATAIETLTVPEGITRIGPYAFKKCAELISINLPDSLTSVGESAFYGCSMENITIPDAVTTIGAYAYKNCANLNSVTLPAALTTLGGSAFHSCTVLTEITIPASVVAIGAYCFSRDTSLKNVIFIGKAPAIGIGAFNQVTADAAYPADDSSWTEEKRQNYGGTISWIALK